MENWMKILVSIVLFSFLRFDFFEVKLQFINKQSILSFQLINCCLINEVTRNEKVTFVKLIGCLSCLINFETVYCKF